MPQAYRNARPVVFVLFLCSLPFACLGSLPLVSALPAGWVPILHVFQAQVRVENHTPNTLYLTPFTTIHNTPEVILQTRGLRARDLPLPPGESLSLSYDMADATLTGVAVCRESGDCRLQKFTGGEFLPIRAFSSLPALPNDWQAERLRTPLYRYGDFALVLLGMLSPLLLGVWILLGRKASRQKA